MPRRSFANRRELEEHHYHPLVVAAVSICALFLHAFLPRIWRPLGIVDVPLIIVIYFSISWRSRVAGTLLGTTLGLLQDLPGNQYIGVNGIAKSLIGYAASSIGLRIDVEHSVTRLLLNIFFFLLQSALLFLIGRFLLNGSGSTVQWIHEILRAGVNAVLAVPLFALLDRTRVDH